VAIAAKEVDEEGRIDSCGGDDEVRDGIHFFHRRAAGEPFETELGTSPSSWVTTHALLVRRATLLEIPFDSRCGIYADLDWSLRVRALHPEGLWACSDAVARWHGERPRQLGAGLVGLGGTLPPLEAAAWFYAARGEVLDAFFALVPELSAGDERDIHAARLFLDLLQLRGSSWLLTAWASGELAPLLGRVQERKRQAEVLAAERAVSAGLEAKLRARNAQLEAIGKLRLWRLVDRYWQLRRSLGRLFGRG